jgi:hypothetical protein
LVPLQDTGSAALFNVSLAVFLWCLFTVRRMESGHLYRIIWRLFKNIELKGRLNDVTGVEI